jgi:arylsulfatase A-like enzyme
METRRNPDSGGISRRDFLETSALGAAAFTVSASAFQASAAQPKSEKKPNLVFVCADQLRCQSCGYAGDSKARTSNINRLAGESANFTNAISGYPMCAPYRASLFTGKYPSSTGMVINEIRCMPDPDAIGHVLTAGGYQTGYIGKWHLYGRNHTPSEQFCPPGPYRLGFNGYWAAHNFNHEYYKAFYYRDTFDRVQVNGYEPDVQTDVAIDFLRRCGQQGEKPFALFLSYGTPHDPWNWTNCPEEYNNLFREVEFPDPPNYADGSAEYWSPNMTPDWWMKSWKPNRLRYRQVYYAMTANLDWNVGRLLKALDEQNLSRDTVFVFTSDHGEMSGAHGRIAKKIFYEEAIRIPFLLRWPEKVPAGRVCDACLDVPDVMPTLLSLMGLPIPSSIEGMDLSHAALGKAGPEPEAAFLQGMGHTFQWRDGDEWRALRDKRYTYAIMRVGRSEYLYDNRNDPYQMKNLANDPSHADTLTRFRDMLRRRMAKLNDTFESTTWYGEHWTKDRIILRSAARRLE